MIAKNIDNSDRINPVSEDKDNFGGDFQKLNIKLDSIERDREITLCIANLLAQGLQTLITKFGADVVLETITNLSREKEGKSLTMKDVLIRLEPDSEKRKQLLREIQDDAKSQAREIDSATTDGSKDDYKYFQAVWGIAKNYVTRMEQNLAHLNGGSRWFVNEKDSLMANHWLEQFASLALQDDEERQKIGNQLGVEKNNIFQLLEQRDAISTEEMNQLQIECKALLEKVTTIIDKIRDEHTQAFEEWRQNVLGDFKSVNQVDAQSEEIQRALREVLQTAELGILQKNEITKTKIEEDSKPLRELLGMIESVLGRAR